MRALLHGYSAERRAALVAALTEAREGGSVDSRPDPEYAADALAGAVFYLRLLTDTPIRIEHVKLLIRSVIGPLICGRELLDVPGCRSRCACGWGCILWRMDGLDPAVEPARSPSRLLAAITAVFLLAGCAGAEKPDATSTTPAPTEHAGPYTRDERALYRQAVRRVEAFEAANQPVLAAGRATTQAKRFYETHLRDWESTYAVLRKYQAQGVQVARRPIVLSSEPVSVKDFQDNAAEIVIHRCTDQSDLGMTRQGAPVPPRYDEPVVQEVVVIRYENLTWRIASLETTGVPCTG